MISFYGNVDDFLRKTKSAVKSGKLKNAAHNVKWLKGIRCRGSICHTAHTILVCLFQVTADQVIT